MSLKNFTFFKILTASCVFLLFSVGLNAQTVVKTSNPSGTVTVDGQTNVAVAPALTFTSSDFTQGCGVSDVNILIRWAKTDGTCAAPTAGSSYHSETGFRLVGPDGTIVNLITTGTYSGNATTYMVNTTFDQASGTNPGGTPTSGTFNPIGDLNAFNGTSGLGVWTLQATDAASTDPLCIDYWRLTISTTSDIINPTASCASVTKVLNGSGIATVTAAEMNNGSSDLCGIASMTVSPSSFDCGDVGLNSVTLTVTDTYGRTSTCSGFVTVQDNQAPTISCPSNVTTTTNSGCNATGVALGTPSTNDNCSSLTVTNDAPGAFPIGTTTVTWTVTDPGGNTDQCTQTVTVTDGQAPTIDCPGPISINTSPGQCASLGAALGTPTTTDNCNVASVTNNAPTAFPLGATTVVWTVTDDAGNTTTCSQTVLVQDNENPDISCASAITISTDPGSCTASSSGLSPAAAIDNCGVSGVTNNAPANLPIGNNLIQWTAVDAAGNIAQCTQTVTVADQEAPSITCPPDRVWDANFNGCSYLGANLGTPVTSDNCSVANVTNNGLASYPQGVTEVIWTVTDNAGNTTTCTQTITIVGGNTLNGTPTDQTCGAANGSIDLIVTGTNVMPNGNYAWSNGDTTEDPTGLAPGDYTVTVTNTNGCTISASYTVGDVADVTPPTILCPADINMSADAPGCSEAASVSLGTPTTSDDCNIASTTNDAPATFPVGSTNVIWTVTDDAGLIATCTQVVTITGNDTAISLDGTTNETCGLANGTITISITGTAAASYLWSNGDTDEDPTGLAGGDYTVTVTNTDGCTVASATYTVGVDADLVDPVILCPADVNTSADTPDCSEANITLVMPTTSDDCGVATVTNDAPATFPVGSTDVIWTVTDNAGNTATCTQNVTVTGSDTAISLDGIADENCNTANGTISISITGTAAASYLWSNGDTNEDLTGLVADDYTVTVTNTDGCTTSASYTVADVSVACALEVMPKVFLEGAYAGGAMGDQLRTASLVPTEEPYTADGYTHAGPGGGEMTTASVLAVTGTDAIVDWVVVELRDAATPATVVATRAALVQKDGDVVDVDGVSSISFTGIAPADYNVAIRHRNHLGVMSMNAITLSSTPVAVDFTSAALVTYGTDARKDVGGVMCLHAGNVSGDGTVRATGPAFINDASQILSRLGAYTNVVTGTYENQDINMDGNIRATGPAFINDSSKLLGFLGGYTNSRTEQLP